MAAYQVIKDELNIAKALQQSNISAVDLEIIAREWSETLRGISDAEFSRAMRLHRKTSAFMPRECNIVALVVQIRAEAARKTARLALPGTAPDDAGFARNAAKAAELVRILSEGAEAVAE